MCCEHVPSPDCLLMVFYKKLKEHLCSYVITKREERKERKGRDKAKGSKNSARQRFVFISGNVNAVEDSNGNVFPSADAEDASITWESRAGETFSDQPGTGAREQLAAQHTPNEAGLARASRVQCWAGKTWSHPSSLHPQGAKKGNRPSWTQDAC